jgi:hypothetical protein
LKGAIKTTIKFPDSKSKKAAEAEAKPKPPIRRRSEARVGRHARKERAHFRDLLLKKKQDLMRAYAISKGGLAGTSWTTAPRITWTTR